MKVTIESRVLEALDSEEGTESFNLPASPRQARGALQRLRHKGLAEAVRCPDGAWVWFRTNPDGDDHALVGSTEESLEVFEGWGPV